MVHVQVLADLIWHKSGSRCLVNNQVQLPLKVDRRWNGACFTYGPYEYFTNTVLGTFPVTSAAEEYHGP